MNQLCSQSNIKQSINFNKKDKHPLCFRYNKYGHKSYECTKPKDVKHSIKHSQVNMVTSSQNLILKEVKLYSLH